MGSFQVISILINLLFSFVLFMLLAYKYARDKHRAALSWALVGLLLSIQVLVRMLFARQVLGEDISVYVIVLISCYMSFLIFNSTLLMMQDKIARSIWVALLVACVISPFYALRVASAGGAVYSRLLLSSILLSVSQLASAGIVLKYFNAEGKSRMMVMAVRLLVTGLGGLSVVSVLLAFRTGADTSGALFMVSSLFKLLLGASLVMFFF